MIMVIISLTGVSTLTAQEDYIKPNILHEAVTKTYEGQPLFIEAVITDNIGVEEVTLFYRTAGERTYDYLPMLLEFNVFRVEIPAEDILPQGLEYYIQASDLAGNITYTPDIDPEDNPYQITYVTFTETSAPDALLIHPESGAVVENGHQLVIISLFDDEDDIDITTGRLVVDGVDVTADAIVTPDVVTYTPPVDFALGSHIIEFSIIDRVGNVSPPSIWEFSVQIVEEKKPLWAVAQIKGAIDIESEYDKYSGKTQPENRPLDTQKPRIKMTFSKDWLKGNLSIALNKHFDALAREVDERRQPLDRFRFSLETPYAILKGGDHNPNFSELTLKGAKIRGVVANVHYKWLRSSIVYGKTKQMIPGITTIDTAGSDVHSKGTFSRKLWGMSTTFNFKEIFEFGLNYLQVFDDTTSITDSKYGNFQDLPDKLRVKYKAQRNTTAGFNSRLSLFNRKTEIIAYWAASVFTDDIIDPDARKLEVTTYNREKSFKDNLIDGTYWIKFDSRTKYFGIKGLYKRVPRTFTSLGNPSIQTDIQGLKLDARTKLLNNQMMLSIGYENTHDNVDLEDIQTTTNLTYSGTMNLSISGLPGVNFGYRMMQRQGDPTIPTFTINDSVFTKEDTSYMKLSEDATTTLTIGPTYSFKIKNIEIGIAGNVMLMNFEDRTNPEANFQSNSYMMTVTQSFPTALNVNFGYGISENIPETGTKTTFTMTNGKVAYMMKNKKVKVYLGCGIVRGEKIGEIDNRKVTVNLGNQYKFTKNQFLGFDIGIITVNDFLDSSKNYSETRAKLKYKYMF